MCATKPARGGVSGAGGRPLAQTGAEENGLAGVGIAHPLIERQDAWEFVHVHDLVEKRVGQEIVDHHFGRVAGVAGSKMPAGFDGQAARAKLQVDLGIGLEKLGRDVDNSGGRRRDLEVIQENGSDPFINQDAPVLGIIAEFDDVEAAVAAFEQVGLRPTAHLADQA